MNIERLTVNVSGGKGGIGQNGGNGRNGKDGIDAPLELEGIIEQNGFIPAENIKYIDEEEYTENYRPPYKPAGKTRGNPDWTGTKGKKKICILLGKNGDMGKSSGKGGKGGIGGKKGIFIMRGTHALKINTTDGEVGEQGNPGNPGNGGKHGRDISGTYCYDITTQDWVDRSSGCCPVERWQEIDRRKTSSFWNPQPSLQSEKGFAAEGIKAKGVSLALPEEFESISSVEVSNEEELIRDYTETVHNAIKASEKINLLIESF